MAESSNSLGGAKDALPQSKANILLVDDNPAKRLSLRALLDGLKCNLVEVQSGEEAVHHVQSDEFAVVLLDVSMAGLGGFEIAKAIRESDHSRRTPIIFLTAQDTDCQQLEEAYALGAVDYLVKPILPVILQAKVRGLVELFENKRRARREAEQFRLLVNGTTEHAIFMLDPGGCVVTWNPGAERLKGYKAEEIIGQHFSLFYPQDANDLGWPAYELKVAQSEGRFEDEGWRVRKDGSQFWANVVITALRDENGAFHGFSKITRDMTARKEAEESLRRSEERFRLLVESARDYAIFLLDTQGKIASWNLGAERIKGYTADEIIGQHFSKFYPQEANDRHWPEHELKVASVEGRFEDEGWRVRKDGSQFWANVVITALKGDHGELLGFSKITRDMTDRKKSEENARRLVEETTARRVAEETARFVQEQRERLHVTLASIGDAVISTDADGRVDFLNGVAENLVGWKTEEAVHRSLADVFQIVNEETRQPVENPAMRALKEGVVVGLANHTVLIAKDGHERPIDDSAAPIRDTGGNVIGSVLVFRDISERRRNEAALAERMRLLALTAAVGEAMVQADSLRAMLHRCAEALVKHLDGAFARIWTLNEAEAVLELRASAGIYTHLDGPHSRVPVGKFKIGLIAQERQPHLTNSVVGDPRVSDQEWAKREEMVAFAGYPLVVDDRLVGVMAMFARQELTEATLAAMASVADGIAVGIERKCSQARLNEQREWLSVTLASIGDAVIATDDRGRVTFLNGVAQRLTGWTTEAAQGKPLEEVFLIFNELTRQPVENPVEKVLREGVIVGLANHTVLVGRDGSERPIDDSAAPIRDTSGKMIGVVLIFRDVTEQRLSNRELRSSEARKTAILETALDCIITMDHEGKVVEFNTLAERTFGFRREQVIGQELADFIVPPTLRERHRKGMAHYLATGEGPVLGKRLELPALRADGTEFPIELAITRISTDGPPLFTAYLRDITERTKADRYRNARLAVTNVMSQAASVRECAIGVLQIICEVLGWDEGYFWMLDPEAEVLRCLESWHSPVITTPEFEATSRQRTFARGEGLPGRVWSSGRPAWICDVVHDANFSRAPIAAKEGLHGAFGCPIVVDGEMRGTIEFFSGDIREPDADLMEMMTTVCGQVGQFIERKLAEDHLSQSERELADFFDNATIGLHWVGPDGIILRANQAELKMLGYNREEYVGRPIAEFHADEDVISDILNRLQAGENLDEYPARLRCKDGSIRDVVIASSVLRKDGEFIHTRCLTRDITEQKQAEQKFTRFMQHLPGLAWIKDLQGRYIYANDAAKKAFRTPGAELDGRTDDEVFPQAIAAQFKENDQQAMSSGVQVVEALEHGDGVVRYSLVNKFPILGSDGRAALIGGMAIDITDQRRAEAALRESEEKLRLLANTIPQLAWMARPDGYIFWYNRRWFEYTGTTSEQMEGWGWQTVLDPQVLPKVVERWKISLATGEPFDMVFPLKGADEQFRPFLTRVNPLRDSDNRILYWFGTNTDISDIKQMEEALRDADRRKDEFLATLAHELRNPLAPIRNSLQILKMPRVDAETSQQTREMMERQVQLLVRLVDDLLDVSRVMRGKIDLRLERVELASIVARAIETAKPTIEVQRHQLDVSIPPDSLLMTVDPVRLVQVVGNLLTNSAKYTEPEGHIWLSARQENGQLILSVRDNGIGIARDMLPHVFELFVQADSGSTKAQGGLGIGLTLAKNLIEMHNGTIEAHSSGLSKGSEFIIRLPLLVEDRKKPQEMTEGELDKIGTSSGLRLLIVDDNRDAAISLAMLLRLQNHEVRVVHDGASALSAATSFRPDLVFLDLGMPGMDGYEVARRIRTMAALEGVVLAAVTGWGQQEDRRRTSEAGFDYHLVKPVDPSALEELLASLPKQ